MKRINLLRWIGFILFLSIFLFLFSFNSLALIQRDFKEDGCFDFEDLMLFAFAYGSCEGDVNWDPNYDLYPDGCINFEDLMIFAMNYGECEITTIHSPEITLTAVTTATIDELYTYDVEASDPDGDTLTYSLTVNPAGMTIDPSDGLINWTPSEIGDYEVTIQVSDGDLLDAQSFSVKVISTEIGTVELVVSGSGSYDLKMDGITYFFDKLAGTYTIYDVPVGSHTFEAINMKGANIYYDSVTEYISNSLNLVNLIPVLIVPDIRLATVEEIAISILETFPVQVLVNASGYHPDPCTNIYQIYQVREGDTFFITITTYRPSAICITIIDPFTETIPLEVNGLPAGTYTLDVNGIQGSFTLETNNISLIDN